MGPEAGAPSVMLMGSPIGDPLFWARVCHRTGVMNSVQRTRPVPFTGKAVEVGRQERGRGPSGMESRSPVRRL